MRFKNAHESSFINPKKWYYFVVHHHELEISLEIQDHIYTVISILLKNFASLPKTFVKSIGGITIVLFKNDFATWFDEPFWKKFLKGLLRATIFNSAEKNTSYIVVQFMWCYKMCCVSSLFKFSLYFFQALQELHGLCDQSEAVSKEGVAVSKEGVLLILPYWPRLYSRLSVDIDRRIREATQRAHLCCKYL